MKTLVKDQETKRVFIEVEHSEAEAKEWQSSASEVQFERVSLSPDKLSSSASPHPSPMKSRPDFAEKEELLTVKATENEEQPAPTSTGLSSTEVNNLV